MVGVLIVGALLAVSGVLTVYARSAVNELLGVILTVGGLWALHAVLAVSRVLAGYIAAVVDVVGIRGEALAVGTLGGLPQKVWPNYCSV